MYARQLNPDNAALHALLSGRGPANPPGIVCDHCGKTMEQAGVRIFKACGDCHDVQRGCVAGAQESLQRAQGGAGSEDDAQPGSRILALVQPVRLFLRLHCKKSTQRRRGQSNGGPPTTERNSLPSSAQRTERPRARLSSSLPFPSPRPAHTATALRVFAPIVPHSFAPPTAPTRVCPHSAAAP